MKLSEDSLFRLIRCLTATEELRFIKYAQSLHTKDDAAYLKLFDIIRKQDKYDAKEIQQKTKEIDSNIAKTKQYLYNILIDYLVRNDQSDHPIIQKVEMLYRQAKFLHSKGMYKEAMGVMTEAKKEANKYDFFTLLTNIIHLEISLIYSAGGDNLAENLQKAFNEKSDAGKKEAIIDQYKYMFGCMGSFISKGISPQNILSHPTLGKIIQSEIFLNHDVSGLPFMAQYFFHKAHITYYGLLNDIERSFAQQNKIFDLWLRFPDMKKSLDSLYYQWLTGYLHSKEVFKDFSNIKILFDEYKTIGGSQLQQKAAYNHSVNLIKSRLALCAGNIDASIRYANIAINSILTQGSSNIDMSNELIGYLRFSFIYFMKGDMQKVIYYLDKMDTYHTFLVKHGWGFITRMRIMRMLVSVERKKFDLLEDFYEANKKYFDRKKELTNLDIVDIFMQFFKEIILRYNERELLEEFKAFKNKLLQDNLYRHVESFIGFDILIWLDSKITNKPMQLLLKEKAEKEYPEIFEVTL